ncbi:MAG: cytochrome P450 [Acidimicrobiales bacterium]
MVVRQLSERGTGAATEARIPGPKGSLLLGSLFDLRRDILGFMRHSMLEYGDVVRARVGPPSARSMVTFVYHPDGVAQVLAGTDDNYYKGTKVYDEISDLLGKGLLTSDGEDWRRQRRLVAPLFNRKTVSTYVPMIADEATRLVGRWAGGAGSTVDLHGEMTAITLRVIGRAVFGTEVDHMVPTLRDSVPYLSSRALRRGLAPVVLPPSWPTPENRVAARHQGAIFGLVDDLIASRRKHPTEGHDLVNLLIDAQDPEGGLGLSDVEVRDQALIFLLAGHETTATALTFALHLLGHHLDIQAQVAEESAALMGAGAPTLEVVNRLTFTTMVVKEAMRLYPSAAATSRMNRRSDTIGGYAIGPCSTIVVSPWATHRHPGWWHEPDRFDPERFAPGADVDRPRYAYFPFGGGPRACIGQYFSMVESVLVTAAIIGAFALRTDPEPVPLFTGITLRPARAMPASLTPR